MGHHVRSSAGWMVTNEACLAARGLRLVAAASRAEQASANTRTAERALNALRRSRLTAMVLAGTATSRTRSDLMALTVESAPVEQQPRAPYWTLDDYHQAIDAGVFSDRRIELINGTLYEMPPLREPHIGATNHLAARFYTLGERRVRSQMPIILPHDGEPEPDIVVVEADAPLKPSVAHVQLVIEVSYATRQFDRGVKLEAYLAAGLREVWIVDLVERCLLVYRDGVLAGRYAAGENAKLMAVRVPEVTIDLDALFHAAGGSA
jgi:Uma2 family endonuclease